MNGDDLIVVSWAKYALTSRQRKYEQYERSKSQSAEKSRERPRKAEGGHPSQEVEVEVEENKGRKEVEENITEHNSENCALTFRDALKISIPKPYYEEHLLRAKIIQNLTTNNREMTIISSNDLSAGWLTRPGDMKRLNDILHHHLGPDWKLIVKAPCEPQPKQ